MRAITCYHNGHWVYAICSGGGVRRIKLTTPRRLAQRVGGWRRER